MQITSLLENQIDADLWINKISTFLYSEEGRKTYEEYFNHNILSFAKFHKGIFADYINKANDEKLKTNLRKSMTCLTRFGTHKTMNKTDKFCWQ